MRGGVALALFAALAVLALAPENFWLAAPWLIMWVAAPLLARYISVPHAEHTHLELSEPDAVALRLIARRTWGFLSSL